MIPKLTKIIRDFVLILIVWTFLVVFIRLRLNTLQLAAGMKGKVNRAEAHQSEGGLNPLYHFNVGMATAQLRFDTPQLAAGIFIVTYKVLKLTLLSDYQ